ncbi:hypothetical protein D3C86_1978180 [compost metagenome]
MRRRDREQAGTLAICLGMSDRELDATLRELGEEFGDFIDGPTDPALAAVVDLETRRRDRQTRGNGERV